MRTVSVIYSPQKVDYAGVLHSALVLIFLFFLCNFPCLATPVADVRHLFKVKSGQNCAKLCGNASKSCCKCRFLLFQENVAGLNPLDSRYRQKWLQQECFCTSPMHYAPLNHPASTRLLCTSKHLHTLCHTPSWPLIGSGLMEWPGLLSRRWWSESIFGLCTPSSSSGA